MNSEQRKRVAARFARAWKREVRIDEGREHQRENLEARQRLLLLGVTKRMAMLIVVGCAAAILVLILLYGR
jgi:hypothetical protein